jgi:hypothetical protein
MQEEIKDYSINHSTNHALSNMLHEALREAPKNKIPVVANTKY